MAKARLLDLHQCNHEWRDYAVTTFLPDERGSYMFAAFSWPPRAPLAVALKQLPQLLGGAARVLPFVLQRQCILLMLQQVLQERINTGDLDFLGGRQLQIWISDADIRWTFGMQQQRLTLSQSTRADTVIRGKLAEFILLASRKEDPDTLFFQRRLAVEGDTDLGLELKNVLNTLDTETLPARLNAALDWLANQYQPSVE
jgi:predicted lipid carrier protein YhbT